MYLEQCHAVAGLITQAKIEYYRERLGSASAKDTSRFVNSLFQKMSAGMQSSESNKTLADKFATFFKGIRKGLDSVEVRHFPLTGEPLMPSPLESFAPTSEQQLSKIIRASPNKSCSLDPIPTWLLKEQSILQAIAPALVSCINASFTSGDVPEFPAMVKPLLKKSCLDQRELSNYRPVSNLSFLIKVMEKIMTSQIVEHMNTHELFNPYQSACRSGYSTETALLKIKNDSELALDRSESVLMVLLDLSAAFDTIDHAILLDRLKSRIGISGAALQWLKSYLSNRTFQVAIGSDFSDPVHLDIGVPQGSVLGPLLFLVYILPVGDILFRHNIMSHGYADDTQMYCYFNPRDPTSLQSALRSTECCLDELGQWMVVNKLKLNAQKTEFIIFTPVTCDHLLISFSLFSGSAMP